MTALTVVATLVALLLIGAAAVPRLLGHLAPALSARPRWGLALWTSAAVSWVLGLLAVGPLLAWAVTGPALPGQAGAVCRRCLAAANPFSADPGWTTQVPTYLLVLVPAASALALTTAALARLVTHRRALRRRLRTLAAVAELRRVHGTAAWVLPTADPVAYALPRRRDGIVLSQGTLDALRDDEVAAVLVHERAHVRGRHHALIGAVRILARVLAWVPLLAAAPGAVAGYAEMAADDDARRARGTRALAGALLALHGSPALTPTPRLSLHAARHEPVSRVRRLVATTPPPSPAGLTLVAAYLTAVAAAVLLVSTPYLSVIVTGAC